MHFNLSEAHSHQRIFSCITKAYDGLLALVSIWRRFRCRSRCITSQAGNKFTSLRQISDCFLIIIALGRNIKIELSTVGYHFITTVGLRFSCLCLIFCECFSVVECYVFRRNVLASGIRLLHHYFSNFPISLLIGWDLGDTSCEGIHCLRMRNNSHRAVGYCCSNWIGESPCQPAHNVFCIALNLKTYTAAVWSTLWRTDDELSCFQCNCTLCAILRNLITTACTLTHESLCAFVFIPISTSQFYHSFFKHIFWVLWGR